MSFDGQVVRPDQDLLPLYNEYVCVRVTNMRGIDLNRYRFDFDLTLAVLLMNPDGTIYNRYGGRDHRAADVWLNKPSLARVLRDGLIEHSRYQQSPAPPATRPRKAIENVDAFARKDKGECIHCHSVNPALREEAVSLGNWKPEDLWIFPTPGHVGLELSPTDQTLITRIAPDSPAAICGLRPMDRLLTMGGSGPISTISDVQWALHNQSPASSSISVSWKEQDGKIHTGVISVKDGWKQDTPLAFSWRPSKWGLTPAPGFGGRPLKRQEKKTRGFVESSFAFRVGYLVTWGDQARYGRIAAKAGLRVGDIVTAIQEKGDFRSVEHFHAWWRLTRKAGETVPVDILRQGKKMRILIPVIE